MKIISANITGSLILNNVDISSVTGSQSSINSLNSKTGSYATTGSNAFIGQQNINGSVAVTGSLTTTGTIVAQTLNVQQVTSSVVYSSGSNIFGNSVSNTQQFTGSLQVTGSAHYLLGSVGINNTNGTVGVLNASGRIALTSGLFFSSNLTSEDRWEINGSNSSYLGFIRSGVNEYMRITSGSNVLIGTTTDAGFKLDVNGTGRFSGVITGQTTSNGNITQNFLAYNSGTSIAGASYDFSVGGTSQTARISANYEASSPDRMAMRFWVGQGSGLVELLKLYNNTMTVTGAATFSSSIAATSATFTAAVTPLILKSTSATTMYTEYYYNTSTLSGYIGSGGGILTGANNSDFIIRSEADFVVATGGNNRRLTIASTGAATFSGAVTATLVNVVYNNTLTGQTADDVTLATYTAGSSNELLQITITLTNNNATGQVRSTFTYTTDDNDAATLGAIATTPQAAVGEGQAVIALNIKNGTTLTIKSLITVGGINYNSRVAITKIL